MKRIMIIVGTRPEAIKLFPVWSAFKKNTNFHTTLLTTGQHGPAMMMPLLTFFGVTVEIELNIMVPNQTINEFASSLMLALDHQFKKHKPDLIVVQGDTTSCMIGSLAAFYSGILIAHVEAGLRTFSRQSPFPEEVNRRITSLIADFHFVPTESARQNLVNERVEGKIEVVGNTVIDSLLEACKKVTNSREKYIEKFNYLTNRFEKIVAITAHRRENIGVNFREIYSAIKQLAYQYPTLAFVYPLHVNPIVKKSATEILKNIPNVFLIDPLPYDEMVFLMQECYVMMTDSGGIQEECPTLSKPVLVLRDTTERPEGIEAGCSILVGVKRNEIVEAFTNIVTDKDLYNRMTIIKNPYGEGDSSKRIVKYLESSLYSYGD